MSKELLEAARNGDLNEVKELLARKFVIASLREREKGYGKKAVFLAAKHNHTEVLKHLVQNPGVLEHIDVELDVIDSILIPAASNGNLEAVNCLLTIPAIAAEANRSLDWAARKDRLEVVERLLQEPVVLEDIT